MTTVKVKESKNKELHNSKRPNLKKYVIVVQFFRPDGSTGFRTCFRKLNPDLENGKGIIDSMKRKFYDRVEEALKARYDDLSRYDFRVISVEQLPASWQWWLMVQTLIKWKVVQIC